MRRFWFASGICLAIASIAGCGSGEEKKASLNAPVTVGDHIIGQPIASGNVTIYPVSLASYYREAKKPEVQQEVISLQEARRQDIIEIRESNGGMQIDTLAVTNKGKQRVLLMTGELLLGGHQDRVVGADTVVEPGQTVDVPVFCVEHGRSSGPTDKFEPSDQPVPLSVKTAAIMGEQEVVWSRVAGFNAGVGMNDHSISTINAGLQMAEVQRRVNAGYDKLWRNITGVDNSVGAIVVVGGKIRTLEIFGNSQMFHQGLPTILRSTLAESAMSFDSNRSPSAQEVKTFFEDAIDRIDREGRRNEKGGSIRGARIAGYLSNRSGKPDLLHATFLNLK